MLKAQVDAKTGKLVWDTRIGDIDTRFEMTGGPLVAEGMVMIGTSGRGRGGNYIVGLDAETGDQRGPAKSKNEAED